MLKHVSFPFFLTLQSFFFQIFIYTPIEIVHSIFFFISYEDTSLISYFFMHLQDVVKILFYKKSHNTSKGAKLEIFNREGQNYYNKVYY